MLSGSPLACTVTKVLYDVFAELSANPAQELTQDKPMHFLKKSATLAHNWFFLLFSNVLSSFLHERLEYPDRLPDQDTGSGTGAQLYLFGPEGWSSADLPH